MNARVVTLAVATLAVSVTSAQDSQVALQCIEASMKQFGLNDQSASTTQFLPKDGQPMGLSIYLAEFLLTTLVTHAGKPKYLALGADDSRMLADALSGALNTIQQLNDPSVSEFSSVKLIFFGLESPHPNLEVIAESAQMGFEVVVFESPTWESLWENGCAE